MLKNYLHITIFILLSLSFFHSPAQGIKYDVAKKKYFLESDSKAHTKAIYDTIIYDKMMEFAYVTKTQSGYGLLSVWGDKIVPLLSNEYEEIICTYYRNFAVKKNGKYAKYIATDNIDLDEKDKPYLLSKTPIFKSEFVYDKVKYLHWWDRIYFDTESKWETFTYAAFWQNGEASISDFINYRHSIAGQGIKCDELELINIDTKVFFKCRLAGKFGIADSQYGIQIPIEYDSITHVRTMLDVSGRKNVKITNDFLILHKGGKMNLANFTRGSYFVNYNFPIDAYNVADNTLFFTEKGKPMKMVEGKKVSSEYELLYSDKYEMSLIQKNKLYGIMHQNRVILEPIYDDYERLSYCGGDTDIYLFKKDGYYSVFSAGDKKLRHTTEQITDYNCNDLGVYVKRGDGKWYVLAHDKFSYFGRPVIGYDSIVELDHPSYGILAYTNGKIHHYYTIVDYDEVKIPSGAEHIVHISETKGFFYQIGNKYGYTSASFTFDPILTNLNIGTDKKKGSTIFSTTIEGKEYLFYPEDIGADNTIKSFVDCDVCDGRGYNFEYSQETRTIKGHTSVSSRRVFLWRDGETIETTTTITPDREESFTSTDYVDCDTCSGTGNKPVRLRNLNGILQVD